MTVLLWIWWGLLALVLLVWGLRLVLLGLIRRIFPPLCPEMYAESDGDLPSVSLLVAARDEEGNIAACIDSITAQDYPRLQLIAVDDRSGDATGEILDRLAAAESRLRVHHVRTLPEHWYGKNHAMHTGAASATAEWLWFTDADCTMSSPRSLSAAMRYALDKDADFLSVLPEHKADSFWERVVQPACSAILLLWFNPLSVNKPGRAAAYANGAFMLMRRTCYDAIGGHAAVSRQINEDMALARRAKAAGRRLVVASSRGMYTVRMYGTLRAITAGWTRIFSGCFTSVGRVIRAILVLFTFSLAPWLTLGACLLAGAFSSGDTAWTWLGATTIAACAMQLAVMAVFYGLSRAGWQYGLLYPLGAVLGTAFLLNAARCMHGLGIIHWRGTAYRNGGRSGAGSAGH